MVESEFTVRNIGFEFVRQYYTLLNKQPSQMHRFYSHNSSFVHGDFERKGVPPTEPSRGQREIDERIKQLAFDDARTHICQIDAQSTTANGLVVQVSGLQCSNPKTMPMRPFVQTFVLMSQAKNSYFVLNDIFRYQDEMQIESHEDDARTNDGELDNESQSKQQLDANTDSNIIVNNNNNTSNNDVDGRLQHMVNGHRSEQVVMNNGSITPANDLGTTDSVSHHHQQQQNSTGVGSGGESHYQPTAPPVAPPGVASATAGTDIGSHQPPSDTPAVDSLLNSGEEMGETRQDSGGASNEDCQAVYSAQTVDCSDTATAEDTVPPVSTSPVVNVPQTYANRLKSRRSAAQSSVRAVDKELNPSTAGQSTASTSNQSTSDSNQHTAASANSGSFHQQQQHRYNNNHMSPTDENQHQKHGSGGAFNNNSDNGGGSSGFGQHHHSTRQNHQRPSYQQHQSGASSAVRDMAGRPPRSAAPGSSAVPPLSEADRKQVFVGGLPTTVTQEALKQLFSEYGVVVSVRIISKSKTQRVNSHYAFVSMDSAAAVTNILENKPITLMHDGERLVLNVDQKQSMGRGPQGSGGGPGIGRGGGPRTGGRGMGYAASRGGPNGPSSGRGGFNGGGFQMGNRR